MHCYLCLFCISLLDKVFRGCFKQDFHLGDKKVVAVHVRWVLYTVMFVWEFAVADSALVVLEEWSSYRGGHLNRFNCNAYS